MPPARPGTVHETPKLIQQLSGETKPFLNDLQRQALDAALATKMAKMGSSTANGAGPRPSSASHSSKELLRSKSEVTQDRKSRTGKSSMRVSKKDGAGGKYTWGSVMDSDDTRATDPRDPNYDSEDDGSPVAYKDQPANRISEYKQAVTQLLEEHFDSGDIGEVARSLQEREEPELEHLFVKKAITMAMDRHDREREMTSLLLSSLYGEVISSRQMQKGFTNVVSALEDLKIDVPDACTLAATFTARAVVDDILPPSFVGKLGKEGMAAEARAHCESILGGRHAAERALRCWGSGAGLAFEATRDAIRKMLQEYLDSHDTEEVRRRLNELAVPFFHHEVVKQALVAAMQESGQRTCILALLAALAQSSDIPASQMLKGFKRVADNLNDTALDNPRAAEEFPSIVAEAQKAGWLESDFEGTTRTEDANGEANGSASSAAHGVASYKEAAAATISEYFESGEVGEVVRQLVELDEPGMSNIFVKHLVMRAMDRRSRECELASVLLAALHPRLVDPQQSALGFTRLLAAADDAALDTPAAPHLLALFLGRAIVDEVLPPAFLVSVLPALPDGCLGVSVVHAAGAMLKARHAAERLQGAWHGGAFTIDQLRAGMQDTLAEFVLNHDEAEAARCLAELGVPHYHHEFVKRALVAAFQTPKEAPTILALLSHLASSNQITQTQMRKGFERVAAEMEDIKLDHPAAPGLFVDYRSRAEAEGWLLSDATTDA